MRHSSSPSLANNDGAETLRRKEQVFVVDGLHCASCATAVEAQLRRQPGVFSAAVNFAADSAVVCWDGNRTPLTVLQHAVARLGYRLRPPRRHRQRC